MGEGGERDEGRKEWEVRGGRQDGFKENSEDAEDEEMQSKQDEYTMMAKQRQMEGGGREKERVTTAGNAHARTRSMGVGPIPSSLRVCV